MEQKAAFISVYDKTNLVKLGNFLIENDYVILSAGDTVQFLRDNNIETIGASLYKEHPEINNLSVVVCNLKPFSKVLDENNDENSCLEEIDTGGISILRAASKTYNKNIVLSSPEQYDDFMDNNFNNKELALEAYKYTSTYDSKICNWLSDGNYITQNYEVLKNLKYGCNPYQNNASILKNTKNEFPFKIINGNPGYINILDAVNAWSLVFELKMSLALQAAASFKHTSPAGVAIYRDLSNEEKTRYNISSELSSIAQTYIRARNCDPKSSFGDFIAVNSNVDITLANVLRPLVCDGIIAPSYDKESLNILKKKKKGNFIILEGNQNIIDNNVEYRQFKNCVLSQSSNVRIIDSSDLDTIVTENKNIKHSQINDMIMALVSLKYTQSNSVGYAYNGQMIGIGAGQQSRIDCVRLARMKAETWFLRQHPKINDLKFIDNIKRQDKVNAIIAYIEDDFTQVEYNRWLSNFTQTPEQLTYNEKRDYLNAIRDVILASDAFFPFRDSIDKASKIGVNCIVQPGGSSADERVIEACNEYNMVMINTNIRLFHH